MAAVERDDFKRSHTLKAASPHLANGRHNRNATSIAWTEQAVRERLEEYEMTDKVRERMSRCIEALEAVALRLGRNWRVSPFGSAANGFGTKFSDLDATCYELPEEEEEEEKEQKQPAEILSERLAPLLREHPDFTMAQEVLHARVPILKLCFEGELEVDLSCHNTLPLQNTKLLKAYSSLDPRVRDLVITVKLWAKAHEVCGASQSHLSSYALTLMAIYFMQVHPKIKLVMLPVAVFKEDGNADAAQKVEAARSSWTCSLNLGQMVLRFFQFYSQEFDWGREVVSIRFGQRRLTNDAVLQKLKGRTIQRLHVEDPVDETRNLNCVLGDVQEHQLIRQIQGTYMRLQKQQPVSFGIPPLKDAKEEPLVDGEPASSPGRPIRVYDHLPSRQERMLAPSAVEALRYADGEVTDNTRTHSLSEASTAASCASSTDEAMIEHHEVGGRAADTSAYLEAPMNGVRGRHTKELRTGRLRGTEAKWLPESMDQGYAHHFGHPSELAMHKHLSTGQGRQQGKELLSLLHQKHDVPVEGPPGPPATLPPGSTPPQPPLAQSPPPKTGQSSLPGTESAAPRAEQPAPRGGCRMTRNIMAKVMKTCEAHNQTDEKVWQ